ncbi:trinucleotide repeat-containing gene 6B protein-like isoform X1 [Lates japonicus]|uniref:Trinucleotide repeat-containing gene 6B protein-like isoform X1 n=1 Tax=Lates japonicus TaxID=270547 RepID=A0AAD3M7L8_LATJO|nr:trinucleotide repeat-containing gene 6B protein-like isoform X1 [Lates japonicus]
MATTQHIDYKTSWASEPIDTSPESRGSSQSQLSRPPPGLASQKQPSPSPWSGGAPRLAGRGWGGGSSTTDDGFHIEDHLHAARPLLTFLPWPDPGTALIRHGSKQEAAKAQSALHM